MNILLVGGGGREHALVQALKKSPRVETIFVLPGNGGIAQDAVCVPIAAKDIDGIVQFAADPTNGIDFAVVAPDDPLVLGCVDALNKINIPCFGPNAAAARIEGSKIFAKDLMHKYHIPTAACEVFDDPDCAIAYLRKRNQYPAVIKADGLALGKGVLIAENEAEAVDAVHTLMVDKKFGASGDRIIIEEFLTGPEVSVLSFTDGKTIVPMVSSMDHKRALDGDQGANTGGMGTVAPNPHYTSAIAEQCRKEIFLPTIEAMRAEGCPFKGCLYFGLMLAADGPKVIEYNCRFGDPETQVVLPLLQTDLLTIMEAVAAEKLATIDVRFADDCACCVVLVSGGYPGSYEKGYPIDMSQVEQRENITVCHAGTALKNGQLVTAGGRVLNITACAPTVREAIDKAYAAAEKVKFTNVFYRRDIGARCL